MGESMTDLIRFTRSTAAVMAVVCGCQGGIEGERPPSDSEDPNGSPANPTGPEKPDPAIASGACKVQPARLWKLTPTQYNRTVQALLGDPKSTLGSDLGNTLPPKNGF